MNKANINLSGSAEADIISAEMNLDIIGRLNELKEKGDITEEEFEKQMKAILE